jgi:hypothetical protein
MSIKKKEKRARKNYMPVLDSEFKADIDRLAREPNSYEQLMKKGEVSRKMNYRYKPLKPGQKPSKREKNKEYIDRMNYDRKSKGGKLGIDNSGQKIIQKLYKGGKV